MSKDYAISSKMIRDSNGWVLIFTSLGKYFFFNSQNGERCWIPPEPIIKILREKYSPSAREMFFDPFYQEEEEEEEEEEVEERNYDESDEECEDEIEDECTVKNNDIRDSHSQAKDEEIEAEFKLYLLKQSVDPFAPWPTILSLHSQSPQFQSIPSDKRRQDLFAQVCPILIEQKRAETKRKAEEAKKWWDGCREEYAKLGWNWFQVIKKVKGNPNFALLNEKECEKEYKNLLNKLRWAHPKMIMFSIFLYLFIGSVSMLSLPFSSNNFPSSNGMMRAARPVSWVSCGTDSDLFRLDSLEISPDPPRRSAPLTVNVKGYLKETLDEGVVNYEAKFGGFTLATGKLDGCPTLKQEPKLPQCPVAAGKIDVTHTVDLPWHVPPGRYLINAKGTRSADGRQIFCIDLDVLIDLIGE